MIKILLRIAGFLLAVAAVIPIWFGLEAFNSIKGYEAEVTTAEGQMKSRGMPRETGEKKIADARKEIELIQKQGTIWLGSGIATLVVGVGLLALPSSRKRKTIGNDAVPEPAPVADSAPPSDQPPA